MPANDKPIFPRTPRVGFSDAAITAANTTKDLTSGTIYLLFTADATEGSRVDFARVMPLGTNVATVMRIWQNNGGSTATAANNRMIRNVTLAATTNSETAALPETVIDLDISLPPGHRLYATIGTAVAAGFHVTTYGGDY